METAPATAGVGARHDANLRRVTDVVRKYWGFDTLRPLQAEAITAALAGRDSLLVMPTGGGKSLCYQAPAVMSEGLDIVVSPLISLMKDQVDGLREIGYPAAAFYSGLSSEEFRETHAALRSGECRLLFVAPERLVGDGFLDMLQSLRVRRFAIDEAHCISHWGHDFRPEYRRLAELRKQFPSANLHAFTATATPRVQQDIVAQLHLKNPAVIVGHVDRPNLVFRILPKVDVHEQAVEIIRRHAGEAVIVYCLSRKDTESMASVLKANRIEAAAYHAGMTPESRHDVQDAFAAERLDVVVATVAFGMGIDRSNVRCILHATMPKTVEHYQQETGRAGRDGLEAECVMLYSPADAIRWESLIEYSAEGAAQPREVIAAQCVLLKQMQKLCNTPNCRHRALCEYFGQAYEPPNCGACDVCLDETEGIEDATVAAQKILSCVARTQERFGVGHVVDVLAGSDTDMIRKCGHATLSTYGLMKDLPKKQIMSMVYQLIDQDLLARTGGEYPLLNLNEASWEVMRGQKQVFLRRAKQKIAAKTRRDELSWEGADRGLAEHLRALRKEIARERSVPPYLVFEDSTLVGLARVRPTRLSTLSQVRGIGEKRKADVGARLIAAISIYCRENKLTTDCTPSAEDEPDEEIVRPSRPSQTKESAFEMFRRGKSVQAVMAALARAESTTYGYLAEFIEQTRPAKIDAWVDDATYQTVLRAAKNAEDRRRKPIFESLGGTVPYELIRLVLAHQQALAVDE